MPVSYPVGWERMGESELWELMWRKQEAADINFLHSLSDYTKGALIYCGLSNHSMCALRGAARAVRPGLFASLRSDQGTRPCERLRALPPPLARLSSEKRASFT